MFIYLKYLNLDLKYLTEILFPEIIKCKRKKENKNKINIIHI